MLPTPAVATTLTTPAVAELRDNLKNWAPGTNPVLYFAVIVVVVIAVIIYTRR
jgi:hypothetical protein